MTLQERLGFASSEFLGQWLRECAPEHDEINAATRLVVSTREKTATLYGARGRIVWQKHVSVELGEACRDFTAQGLRETLKPEVARHFVARYQRGEGDLLVTLELDLGVAELRFRDSGRGRGELLFALAPRAEN